MNRRRRKTLQIEWQPAKPAKFPRRFVADVTRAVHAEAKRIGHHPPLGVIYVGSAGEFVRLEVREPEVRA